MARRKTVETEENTLLTEVATEAKTEVKEEVKEEVTAKAEPSNLKKLENNLAELANELIEQVRGKRVADLNATIDRAIHIYETLSK